VEEKGIDKSTGKVLVEVDPKYFRPAEVELLIGDPTKAKEKLGWEAKVSLKELVSMMVKNDLEEAEKELHLKNGGYEVKNYYE
jgi:GDPmannose 4,6-dehydratase